MTPHKRHRLTIRFDEQTWQRLHYRADAEGLPISALVRDNLARACKRWRPPTPSTSGFSLHWPEDAPAPSGGGEGVSHACVTPPDTPTPVTHLQPTEPPAHTPETLDVCQPPLKGGL